MKPSLYESRIFRKIKITLLAIVAIGLLSSCSPYASLNVGIPFKVGPVYVNPSIGVGSFL